MTVKIYGFGSYFNHSYTYRDIDILIVHCSSTYSSCLEAISLKKRITREIETADISILSASEEAYFNFIGKSGAILLHELESNYNESSFEEVINKIHSIKIDDNRTPNRYA